MNEDIRELIAEEQGVNLDDIEYSNFGNDKSDELTKLIDFIEDDLKTATMLNTFELGLALKVIEDRLWDMNYKLAKRCKDLQRKILSKGGL